MTATTTERGSLLPLVSVDELCELWSVKRSWVYDEVEAGRLPARRLGRQLRFAQTDLVEYVERAKVRK